jgi:group I intron endonuclease
MYIYKITNTINKKIYIGKSVENTNSNIISYYGSGVLIARAIEKYGIDMFNKEIIDECKNNSELCEREKYWISYYNSTDRTIGYNISNGGDGGDTLSNHPELNLIKEKISNSLKGRVFTQNHKDKLKQNHPLKKEENRLKISSSLKGKFKSEIHKSNLSKSIKKLYETGFNGGYKINNPMKNNKYIWIYNKDTFESKRIIDTDNLPNGYIRGRSSVFSKKISESQNGRKYKYYHNIEETQQKRIYHNQIPPINWIEGRLIKK